MAQKLAIFGKTGAEYAHLLINALPDWDVVTVANMNDNKAIETAIKNAEAAIISAEFVLTPGHFGKLMESPTLKIFAQPWVGTDWIDPALLPEGLLVCNATGHAAPMAEYVLGAMLEHVVGLRKLDTALRKGDWSYSGRNIAPDAQHGDLARARLGLVGYGEIAQAVAQRAHSFDMKIAAIARNKREIVPKHLDWIGLQKDLPRLLKESDFLVVTCDLNEETRAMLNADAFAAMKDTAFLVNVARGEVIDEAALFEALRDKRIAGAAIDTWYRYPERITAPGEDPDRGGPFQGSRYDFNALDNVLVTPHAAAHTRGADRGRYESLAETMRTYDKGRRPKRQVLVGTRPRSSAPAKFETP